MATDRRPARLRLASRHPGLRTERVYADRFGRRAAFGRYPLDPTLVFVEKP
jgi:hypothetical protein